MRCVSKFSVKQLLEVGPNVLQMILTRAVLNTVVNIGISWRGSIINVPL